MQSSEHPHVSRNAAPAAGAEVTEPVACAGVSQQLTDLTRRVANSDCTVLISGESGTGKEVLARYIHRESSRRDAPFVAVNCAAIPEHLLEALLFGWERGAFTGAHAAHPGKFEQAQGGSILLDEVSEMPMPLQAKLLRVLQEHEVERLGSQRPTRLNVRVIATTNRRLREDVAAGRFREDLYYRLSVFPLSVTPLRARREDILPLAMRLLARHSRPGARIPALDATAVQRLLAYDWPGNVRELENVMQRALVLCDSDVIGVAAISFELDSDEVPPGGATAVAEPTAAASTAPDDTLRSADVTLPDTLAAIEYRLILEALRTSQGSRKLLAGRLGISPRTLRYKIAQMRAAGIDISPAAVGAV